MSEPQPANQNSNPPAIIPNSATNGNGRSSDRNSSSQQAASTAPSASNNSGSGERSEKSKVSSGSNQSKPYMRRPNKK